MTGNSPPVQSSQRFSHPKLGKLVAKHLASESRRPTAAHSREAFEEVRAQVEASGKPLVFDSFCGTGYSTAQLALRHPRHLVIGIDKSAHRLAKHQAGSANNYLLARADCDDFWRLAVEAGWRLQHHYLLYPNPWPKPGQLQRRVHGSAHFSQLLNLGGKIELRSNWQVYVEEFGAALVQAGNYPHIERIDSEKPLSLFERKYRDSGHQLWRCCCELVHNRRP
jgi:tRNA G46 methylase TrmB